MLSYRHHFHAGNHADVLKHVTLVALLRALTRKEKPLCYIDTHAGRGRYTLAPSGSEPAPEWPEGLGRVMSAAASASAGDVPAPVADWLAVVRELGALPQDAQAKAPASAGTPLTYYPGSPAIAARCLRARDRLVLSELHPADAESLIAQFEHDPRVEAAQRDGHAQLKRCLPPREKRALGLIDPSYERREEIDAVLNSVQTALTRMANCTIAVWYPLARSAGAERLLRACPGTDDQAVLNVELLVRAPDNPIGMNGSGMLVWNPPWQLDTVLGEAVPWLTAHLDQGGGGWRMEWARAPG